MQRRTLLWVVMKGKAFHTHTHTHTTRKELVTMSVDTDNSVCTIQARNAEVLSSSRYSAFRPTLRKRDTTHEPQLLCGNSAWRPPLHTQTKSLTHGRVGVYLVAVVYFSSSFPAIISPGRCHDQQVLIRRTISQLRT